MNTGNRVKEGASGLVREAKLVKRLVHGAFWGGVLCVLPGCLALPYVENDERNQCVPTSSPVTMMPADNGSHIIRPHKRTF